jgi:CheY-like chemotaxis protein
MPAEGFEEQAALRGIHVFLAVDDAESRELMTTVLEYAGALVTGVASAGAVLTILKAIKPDVLLADLGGDGEAAITLIEHVHAFPDAARIPAIVLTAHTGRDQRQRLLKAGFQHHLVKPIDPWELCRVVASLAERGA